MNAAKDPLRRVLLAAGTQTYKHGDTFPGRLENLNGVPEELRTVVESLGGLGYEPERGPAGPYLLDPDVQVLEDAIRSAAQKAQVAVIYYSGHGLKPDRHPYYVLTADSIRSNLKRTALEPRDLLIHLLTEEQEDAGQPLVLVILDCCYSGAGGVEMLRESLQEVGNPNVWVLASASSIQEAQQGLFARAFAAALHSPKIGHLTDFIPFDLFLRELNRALARRRPDQQARLIRGEITEIPEFFPNREYVPEVAGLTVEERQVWVARLRGAPEESTATGFYITGSTGRVRAVEDIAEWLRGAEDHGLAVLTGSPGSGKSTLLALPALLANPAKAAAVLAGSSSHSLITRAAELFAGLPVLSLYARGMDPYQATKAIAEHLGLQAQSPEDLIYAIGQRREVTPWIVVVDAVDESVDPRPLMDTLLLPLTRCPGMKVLVGTRRHLIRPPGDSNENSLLVDLDADDYRDPPALAEYARQLLRATYEPGVRTPYRDATDEITASVADAIAVRATAARSPKGQAESFLLARLLARAVRGRERVPDIVAPGWADRLPADVGAAFEEDLARLGQRKTTIRALLVALAWAQGPGLPWENMWVPVARALAAEDGPEAEVIDDPDDVRWLLENAGGYVVEDLGPGQRSVFRPFHELLAAHLRGEPGRETLLVDPAAGEAWLAHSQQIETAITRALLDTVPAGSGGHRDWELAHPYLRTYLARHAHAAGPEVFARLVAESDYLAVADPTILTPLLATTNPALRTTARAYRRARPLLGTNPSDNAAYLQEAFIAQTGRPPENQDINPTYRTLMARTRRDDSLLTLTGHGDTVYSVVFGTRADGRLLLASGGFDGTVRLWDPDTGAEAGERITGHISGAALVVFGTWANGRLVLASASRYDGTVRLWDPDTGTPICLRRSDHGSNDVVSVAFGSDSDGRPLLAIGGYNGTVRLWEPDRGNRARDSLSGHKGYVLSVAFCPMPDGRPLLATAGEDGTVRLWDLDRDNEAREPFPEVEGRVASVAFGAGADGRLLLASASGYSGTVRLLDLDAESDATEALIGHGGEVESVAFGTQQDGRLLLASGGHDGTVRLWDPDTATRGRERLTGHDGRVESVALGARADGRLLLASAGYDGTVRLWDPDTGTAAHSPLEHGGPVQCVAFGSGADGRLLLASGEQSDGLDGILRLWNPESGTEVFEPFIAHGGEVKSVAFGTRADGILLLASGGPDGLVRLWDPYTGTEACEPLIGHSQGVRSVAFGTQQDGRLLLASGGYDGTVRLWDPDGGKPIGRPTGRHSGWVGSVAFGVAADGRLLLASAGHDGTVRLWDPDMGKEAHEPLIGHRGRVESVAFGSGADGRSLLASAGSDGTVQLWDPVAGTILTTLRRRTAVETIALHGTTLALGDGEGIAVVNVLYPR